METLIGKRVDYCIRTIIQAHEAAGLERINIALTNEFDVDEDCFEIPVGDFTNERRFRQMVKRYAGDNSTIRLVDFMFDRYDKGYFLPICEFLNSPSNISRELIPDALHYVFGANQKDILLFEGKNSFYSVGTSLQPIETRNVFLADCLRTSKYGAIPNLEMIADALDNGYIEISISDLPGESQSKCIAEIFYS